MKTTPAIIKILLHYYINGKDDYRVSPYANEAIDYLVSIDMLRINPDHEKDNVRKFEPNEKRVKVWIDFLCDQPFPEAYYKIPEKTINNR